MNRLVGLLEVLLRGDPRLLQHLLVCDLVKDTIASEQQEVHVVLDYELLDIWVGYNNVWVAT